MAPILYFGGIIGWMEGFWIVGFVAFWSCWQQNEDEVWYVLFRLGGAWWCMEMAMEAVGLGGKASEGILWIIASYCFVGWYGRNVDFPTARIKKYNVTSAYNYLPLVDHTNIAGYANIICHKEVSLKVSLFAWRVFHNRIPTTNNVIRTRVLQLNTLLCAGGSDHQEDVDNLFFFFKHLVWYI